MGIIGRTIGHNRMFETVRVNVEVSRKNNLYRDLPEESAMMMA